MSTELVIYADQSVKDGEFFSNFYSGVLVRSVDLAAVIQRMEAVKVPQNMFGEIPWQKFTENYLAKYIAGMNEFFNLIAADLAKVRIMFTNNQYVLQGLTNEQRQSEYHGLYYQFIKHAFGLQHCTAEHPGAVRILLNLDQMPTSSQETAQFKSFVAGVNHNSEMSRANVHFNVQQIAEVELHDHVLLQCMDVVLGAMAFRLNNKHQVKPYGQRRRGNRTIAKEKLYKHISAKIRQIYPHFKIGESTGTRVQLSNELEELIDWDARQNGSRCQ